jgi:hypothetical protein
MKLEVNTEISQTKEIVWKAISDIKNCSNVISAIMNIEVLHLPTDGLIGLKWKETREMFGKEAVETMWITEAVENEYYCTRAESHGSVYLTKLSLEQKENKTRLTMSFTAEAQNMMVKIISACMGAFIKKSMIKALDQDLADIKKYAEKS